MLWQIFLTGFQSLQQLKIHYRKAKRILCCSGKTENNCTWNIDNNSLIRERFLGNGRKSQRIYLNCAETVESHKYPAADWVLCSETKHHGEQEPCRAKLARFPEMNTQNICRFACTVMKMQNKGRYQSTQREAAAWSRQEDRVTGFSPNLQAQHARLINISNVGKILRQITSNTGFFLT